MKYLGEDEAEKGIKAVAEEIDQELRAGTKAEGRSQNGEVRSPEAEAAGEAR
jgi:hypothetical protein